MYFLKDDKNKILYGTTPKAGCQHIHSLVRYLRNNIYIKKLWNMDQANILDVEKYKDYLLIIFFRNPYERLVSAYREKYTKELTNRFKFKNINYLDIKFIDFVDDLIENKFNNIEKTHFNSQSFYKSDKLEDLLQPYKNKLFYDIKNIDYSYLEKLYNKNIPKSIIDFKGGHSYKNKLNKKKITKKFNKPIYNLQYKEYKDYDVDLSNYYNKNIKKKIQNFYQQDLDFARKYLKINYDISIFKDNLYSKNIEHFTSTNKNNNIILIVIVVSICILILLFILKLCLRK